MQICHVNLASGYHGGENQTLTLIKYQIELGYSLTVVANPTSPFYTAVSQLRCKLVPSAHYLKEHSRAITDGCELIHVHEGRAIYWALIQSMLYKIPYIITRRIDNPLKKRFFANLAYSKASSIVGLSSEIVNEIKDKYPNKDIYKIASSPVSYNVNDQSLENLKQRFENKFLIIHAANMVKHKAFDVSIKAMKQLSQTHDHIHLALLGDGKERDNLERIADGATNISFEGKQSNMGDWFAAAQLQIHPSHSEGLGSVILEGIKAGLPVIATNTGGIPDIITNGASGLLIDTDDPIALANSIIKVEQCANLQATLIAGGQEKIKTFDIGSAAQKYEKIYNKVKK
ncbi:glycosyltransferase family 4 protein [Vibrio coralliirubri]|uniref:glycosyltransferase family 4 protein n=1 Tax=Vibrio coralliirubri TaxID=1516159 RepID=UPI000A36774C|nr:glycosyltransferase family 4 protein [Vibrio coralliirubri]